MNNHSIDHFQTKEDMTIIKLKLIKIAAMINEDEGYSKEKVFEDILAVIEEIEELDVPIGSIRKY